MQDKLVQCQCCKQCGREVRIDAGYLAHWEQRNCLIISSNCTFPRDESDEVKAIHEGYIVILPSYSYG